MSAQWPTSVATDANLYIAVNSLQTNLSGGIDNAVTTIGLNSTTNFPTAGTILIDNEVIKYAGVSGSNLTGCTRGFDGTSAAAHSNGAIVSFAIVADHHNVLKDEIKALETYLSNNLGTGSQPLSNGHRALVSNASGKITESTTTDTEIGYVSGVTSAIQTQLNSKGAGTVTSVSGTTNQITSTGGATPVLAIASPVTLPGAMTAGGNIAMGGNKITGGAAATASTDFPILSQLKVVQVKTTQSSSSGTLTGTGYSDWMSVTITPTSASNTILVWMSSTMRVRNTAGVSSVISADVKLLRGASLVNTWTDMGALFVASGGDIFLDSTMHLTGADAPASTSSLTYKFQIQNHSGTGSVIFNPAGNTDTMVVMEVAP